MSESEQIKALAELDGWTYRKSTSPYQPDGWWSPDNRGPFREREMAYDNGFYKAITSYDAIMPVIQKQTDDIKTDIVEYLYEMGDRQLDRTPAQLCEALLRSVGKWSK